MHTLRKESDIMLDLIPYFSVELIETYSFPFSTSATQPVSPVSIGFGWIPGAMRFTNSKTVNVLATHWVMLKVVEAVAFYCCNFISASTPLIKYSSTVALQVLVGTQK